MSGNGGDFVLIGGIGGGTTGGTAGNGGNLIFQTALTTTAAERMRITNAGLVGIGASDPDAPLLVVATGTTSSTVNLRSQRTAIVSGNMIGGIDFTSNDTSLTAPGVTVASIQAVANVTHTGAALGTDILFKTTSGAAYSEAMRLTGDNRLGLGTSTPIATFAVQGTSTINLLDIASSTGASLLRLTSAGRLGIGTTAPTSLLTVGGTSLFGDTAVFGGSVGVGTTSPVSTFSVAVSSLFSTTTVFSGNTGFGIASPAARVHVDGSMRIEGVPNIGGGMASNMSEVSLFDGYVKTLKLAGAATNLILGSGGSVGTATRVTMGATLTGTTKWAGGVLGPDGKIYYIPYSVSTILIIDPVTGTATTSAMGADLSGGSKWVGGVLGPDGKIYGIPYSASSILIIDPASGTATTTTMGLTLSDTVKWQFGVLGPDGKIYAIPYAATDILIIDPLAGTATRSSMGGSLSGSTKWVGGALGSDGKIYGMPHTANDILIIDPAAGTASRSALGATISGSTKWAGSVLGPNGKIYAIPYSATTILVVDTVAGTATTTDMGLTLSDATKWIGGVLGPDGKIYTFPYTANDILAIDPIAGTASRSALGATISGTSKWLGGALGPDGKIYAAPHTATDILVVPFGGSGRANMRNTNILLSADSAILNFSSDIGVKTIKTGGATDLAIMPGGRVGIGTTTPSALLAVDGTSLFTGNVHVGSSTGDSKLSFGDTVTTQFLQGVDYSDGQKYKLAAAADLGTDFDILTIPYASTTTAYSNDGGTGTRSVTVTTNITTSGGSPSALVDGTLTNSYSWVNAQSVATKYLMFDFGAGASKVVTEIKWYQSSISSHGTWKLQASNDNVTYVDVGSSFTLGGAAAQTITAMSVNPAGFRYYRLQGVSGTLSSSSYLQEIEFKIADASSGNLPFLGVHNSAPNAALDVRGYGFGSLYTLAVRDWGNNLKFVIQDNGNVGIGTSTPAARLHIYPNASSTIGMIIQGDSNASSSIMQWQDGAGQVLGTLGSAANTEGGRGYINVYNPTSDNAGSGFTFRSNGNSYYGLFSLDNNGNFTFKNWDNTNAIMQFQYPGSGAVKFATPFGTTMYLDMNNNVGIGTTSPTQGLHIGSTASGKNVQIASGWLCVDSDDTCTGAGTPGTIYATNGTVSGGADVAENYPTNEALEAGDIVMAEGSSPVYVSKAVFGNPVLGVVSTRPGVLLGFEHAATSTSATTVPVALNGRVPVKVTNENGDIAIGDYLTLSRQFPGFAMKASYSTAVIGQALEAFTNPVASSSGQIMMFVNVGYQNVDNTFVLEDRGIPVGGNISTLGQGTTTASSFLINQKGSGNILQLQQNGQDRLLVASDGSVRILANAASASSALSVLSVSNGSSTLFTISSVGDVTTVGHIIVGKDTAGKARITAGNNRTTVAFITPYAAAPVIVATPMDSPVAVAVTEVSGTGFTITTSQPVTQDLLINWVVVYQPEDVPSVSSLSVQPASSGAQGPAPSLDSGAGSGSDGSADILPPNEGSSGSSDTPPDSSGEVAGASTGTESGPVGNVATGDSSSAGAGAVPAQ